MNYFGLFIFVSHCSLIFSYDSSDQNDDLKPGQSMQPQNIYNHNYKGFDHTENFSNKSYDDSRYNNPYERNSTNINNNPNSYFSNRNPNSSLITRGEGGGDRGENPDYRPNNNHSQSAKGYGQGEGYSRGGEQQYNHGNYNNPRNNGNNTQVIVPENGNNYSNQLYNSYPYNQGD